MLSQDPGDTGLPFDPAEIWARWAPHLTTGVDPTGHFLPEEAPDTVLTAIRRLEETASGTGQRAAQIPPSTGRIAPVT